ncbi:MAG: universal stress protein [Chlorobi bacterium]|nr:universal stress protein [Chlorobiota bacterium]
MEHESKQIVCAVDFSPLSDDVVTYAAALQRCGAQLTLLHVESDGEGAKEGVLKKHLHAFSHYSDILARQSGKAVFMVRYGEPAAEIISCASEQGADLLVLGSHGSMAFTRLLMGSTAETVMRKALCPVVIYKAPEKGTAARERKEGETRHPENTRPPFPANREIVQENSRSANSNDKKQSV